MTEPKHVEEDAIPPDPFGYLLWRILDLLKRHRGKHFTVAEVLQDLGRLPMSGVTTIEVFGALNHLVGANYHALKCKHEPVAVSVKERHTGWSYWYP